MPNERTARGHRHRKKGSLVVVGSGVAAVVQTTLEAVEYMTRADRLFYLVADSLTEFWIKKLNPSATTLADLYGDRIPRSRTYNAMTARITDAVRAGHDVCAVFYGHPGVFVEASHRSVERLQRDGFSARMVPGVSADACLFADLGVDPGMCGIQSFEATDFLLRRRRFDPTSVLLLWQVGVIGETTGRVAPVLPERLATLTRRLRHAYPADHPVVLYRAAKFGTKGPFIQSMSLEALSEADVSPLETLYVPPLRQREADPRILAWFDASARRLIGASSALTVRRRPASSRPA